MALLIFNHQYFYMRIIIIFISILFVFTVNAQQPYFPQAGNWEIKKPSDFGIDSNKLQEAVKFAIVNENKLPRDQELLKFI